VPLHDLANPAALPERPLSTLFQTLFAVHDNAPVRLALDGMRTSFVRQPYLALPLDLHTELWPGDDGGLLLTVYFDPDAVAGSCAADIAKRYGHRLSATIPGGRS
jgi:mycobactin peptide synthetase MbtE